jgi:site-specific recombinase XerD
LAARPIVGRTHAQRDPRCASHRRAPLSSAPTIVFHGRRHPRGLGEGEVTAFLSGLAIKGASASTQNQALSAIHFLYSAVLGLQLPWMTDIVRAKRPVRLPVVLSGDEVAALLSRLRGPVWLMASLMYGGGLRLLETCELRVKDVSFDRGEVTVRDGKGGKDRVTVLPAVRRRNGPLFRYRDQPIWHHLRISSGSNLKMLGCLRVH